MQYLGHGMVSGAGLDVPGPVYNIERGAKVICDKPAPTWGNSKASRSRTSTGEANPGPGNLHNCRTCDSPQQLAGVVFSLAEVVLQLTFVPHGVVLLTNYWMGQPVLME